MLKSIVNYGYETTVSAQKDEKCWEMTLKLPKKPTDAGMMEISKAFRMIVEATV